MCKKIVVIICVLALVGVGVAVLLQRRQPAAIDAKVPESESELIKAVRPSVPKQHRVSGEENIRKGTLRKHKHLRAHPIDKEWTLDDFDDVEHPYSQEDRETALELQLSLDALDEFSMEDVQRAFRTRARGQGGNAAVLAARDRFLAAVAKAAVSANPAVRKEAIAAYAWQGSEMLSELTPMMADADAEVSEEAIDAVGSVLDEQDDSGLRFEVAAAYMSTFSVNEEAIEMLGSTMSASASEIIDPADEDPASVLHALDNRNLVVDTINSLIQNGQGKCVDAAKEVYNDITSEEWISYEEAQRWAQDPDNYEAPGGLN